VPAARPLLRRVRERLAPDAGLQACERRLVWLLGSPRTGTTWLLNLLARQSGFVKVDEPGIGVHAGLFLHEFYGSPARNFQPGASLMAEVRAQDPEYFFAEQYAAVWRPHFRRLMLARFAAHAATAGDADAICLIKEPNGTQAAELLLTTLPQSRMMWVLRDGRDVVDSEVDAVAPGAWTQEYGAPWTMSAEERLRYVEDRAHRWLQRTLVVQRAFDRLPERQRLVVRYEQLRADTTSELERIHAWLGPAVDRDAVHATAEALRFERLPAEVRGKGRFARSASTGGWRDNLTADEQATMERVMGPKLRELGYR